MHTQYSHYENCIAAPYSFPGTLFIPVIGTQICSFMAMNYSLYLFTVSKNAWHAETV